MAAAADLASVPVGPGVHALAARLRARSLPTLTATVFRHVVDAMPDYRAVSALTAAGLRDVCSVSLHQMLGELADPTGHDGEERALALRETGRQRATQGLPLEWLLHSFRLCARAIWQGLVREATLAGDECVRRLLGEAVVVWDALDRVSTLVAKAYREEQDRLARTTRRRRDMVLSGLLERRPSTQAAAAEAEEVLGIPGRGPLLVVIATLGAAPVEAVVPAPPGETSGGPAALGAIPWPAVPGTVPPGGALPEPAVAEAGVTPEALLRAAGFRSAWVTHGARDSGLVALESAAGVDAVEAALREGLPGQATVSPLIDGFDEVPGAHRLAALTLRTLPASYSGLVRVTDRLPHALVAGAPDVSDVLVRHTLGGLLTLRPSEQELYLSTLEALVDADGSFSAAARRLYCHRNTVLKRAHRIEALTGRRLTSTRALTELYLAVLAFRLDSDRPDAPGPRAAR
ncbi:PucR family transcriptional regulator [Cryptosporangium sp. NPDC051539]|uniref:PucR family transcriptional regulator n=1 Tax=Cryptosporangium sp. NPDC051539 TaxID=3363962 RepID=UPI00379FD59C